MSEENAKVVRRFIAALDRQDYDTAILCLHEDAEWHNTAAFPGSQEVVGAPAIISFWRTLVESFDPAEGGIEVEHLSASGERVVAGLHARGRGAGSGVPIEARFGAGFSLRDSRIERVDVSGDYAKALDAAALRE